MLKQENFTEKTLERIKKGVRSPDSQRRRRLSRILLLADGILIVLILLFFYGDKKAPVYETSSIQFKDLDIRFSISTENETGDYLFGITLKNSSDKNIKYFFKKSLAVLSVKQNGKQVFSTKIAEGISKFELAPEKSKTFVEIIEKSRFKIKGVEEKKRKSLFDFSDTDIPLSAVFTLNSEERISTSISFKHGAD